MMKLEVKSIPLRDVLRDLAKRFEVEVKEDCEEFSVEIPEEFGEGKIRGINFQSGLGLIIYDCRFKEDTEIRFTVSKIHPAKFIYCTEGSLQHSFEEEEGKWHEIDKFQTGIVASSSRNGHLLFFKANSPVKICSMEILRSEFISKIECDLGKMEDELQKMFEDITANKKFYHQAFYSLDLYDQFQQIEHCDKEGVIKKLFMESMAYSMLTKQIEQFSDDQNEQENQSMLKKSELEGIYKALTYIKNHLHEPLTINDLSRETGLNPNKLQNGFRLVEKNTVNEYINNKRLETARTLLLSTDLSISEIVYKIGLLNRSYFSRIFKEEFGFTPSDFRTKYK